MLRTFDLQIARQAQTSCPCPHHGTDQCDCQLVVLLVYQDHREPLAIVAHGYEGQTWFSVVDTPQQRADPIPGSFSAADGSTLHLQSVNLLKPFTTG